MAYLCRYDQWNNNRAARIFVFFGGVGRIHFISGKTLYVQAVGQLPANAVGPPTNIRTVAISHWSVFFGLLIAAGGLGDALYFTNFHRLLSHIVSVEKIPLTYGVLGSSTFLS
ncbi:MAG: hypothetical protein ACSLEN_03145 [Candidatus Malihini olakiniferum]